MDDHNIQYHNSQYHILKKLSCIRSSHPEGSPSIVNAVCMYKRILFKKAEFTDYIFLHQKKETETWNVLWQQENLHSFDRLYIHGWRKRYELCGCVKEQDVKKNISKTNYIFCSSIIVHVFFSWQIFIHSLIIWKTSNLVAANILHLISDFKEN